MMRPWKLHFLTALIGLCCVLPASAQLHKQWVRLGDEAMEERDYTGATVYYKEAVKRDSNIAETNIKYADALRLNREFKKAEKWYKRALENDSENKFTESHFWLGETLMSNGDYEGAELSFNDFRKRFYDRKAPIFKRVKRRIKGCKNVASIKANSMALEVSPLGNKLNTYESEFSALLLDDSTLYYSSLQYENDSTVSENDYIRLYRAQRRNEEWQTVALIDSLFNEPGYHVANGSMSPDSSRFYFSKCDADYVCAIYVSNWADSAWQTPEKLEEAINMEGYTTTQPMIAKVEGKEILFFVSDRPNGKGGLDIWNIEYSGGRKYSPLRNMGSRINSPGNEISPFFDEAADTLYFSSDTHPGIGGFDVFKSGGRYKSMVVPTNLGTPVNSPVDDYYFSYDKDRKFGFLTSNREGSLSHKGSTCCNDIYQVGVPEPLEIIPVAEDTLLVADTISPSIETVATIEELNDYLPITLYFHNDQPNPRTVDTTTQLDYLETFTAYTAMEQEYQQIFGIGETDRDAAWQTITDFFDKEVRAGAQQLEVAAKVMEQELVKGARIELAVKGYASPLAKSDYNLHLTLRRIASMQNFLRNYHDGALIPYLDNVSDEGGQLRIRKIPFGEEKANTTVSDQLTDKRLSVYSPQAARERKIEILSISRSE